MSPSELILILAVSGFALYKQTRREEVVGAGRFTPAIVYGVVGLALGAYHLPDGTAEVVGIVVSLALGVLVGLLRGRTTRLWTEGGRVWTQGTALTIGLFVGLFVVKFAFGTVAYLLGDRDSTSLGDIFVMIALMLAVQSEVVWRRARPMGARTSDREAVAA